MSILLCYTAACSAGPPVWVMNIYVGVLSSRLHKMRTGQWAQLAVRPAHLHSSQRGFTNMGRRAQPNAARWQSLSRSLAFVMKMFGRPEGRLSSCICSRLVLAMSFRERHLQGLSSEPLAASLPPPKRRKTAAAAAAKAPAAKPPAAARAPRAASAPAVAARTSAKKDAAGFSSEDSPDEDEGRPAPQGGAAARSSGHKTNGAGPEPAADDIPRADTRHDAELAARLEAELNQPAHPDEGRRRSDLRTRPQHGCGPAELAALSGS